MARPRATAAQREAQRDRIRRAAADIAAEQGPDRVTVRAVAERAGVSQGTIYGYYASLSELMRSLWLEPALRADRQFEAVVAELDDPIERMRALLRGFADFVLANPEVHRRALLHVRRRGDSVEPLDVDALAFHRLLVEAVRDGQAAGVVTEGDERVLAETLWAAVHGALALPVNADAYALNSQTVLVEQMIELVIAGVAR